MTVPLPEDEDINNNRKSCLAGEELNETTGKETDKEFYVNIPEETNVDVPPQSGMEKDSVDKLQTKCTSLCLLTYILCVLLLVEKLMTSLETKRKVAKLYHRVKIKVQSTTNSFETKFFKNKWNLGNFVKTFRKVPYTVYEVFPFLPLLNTYRTNVNQITNPMEFEGKRFATFVNFPDIAGVYVTRIAGAGFYYTEVGDEVVCYKCGLKYRNWKRGDSPMQIHQRLSPACMFILAHTTETDSREPATAIPTAGACGISNGIPKPEEAHIYDIESDKKEFNHPNSELQQQPLPETDVLFDYSNPNITNPRLDNTLGYGYNENTIRGEISRFQDRFSTNDTHSLIRIPETDVNHSSSTTDQLFRGHITENENKAEVKIENPKYPKYANWSKRFESFIRWPRHLTQSPTEMSSAGFFYTGNEDHCRCFCCGGGLKNWESDDNPWIEHARWYKDCIFVRQSKGDKFINDVPMEGYENTTNSNAHQNKDIQKVSFYNHPAVQTVSEFGYDHSLLKKAYESLEKSSAEITSVHLLEAVFEMEEKTKANSNALAAEQTQMNTQQADPYKNDKENNDREHELSVRSLEEENQNLRDQQTCKICLDEPIAIVFLPCGHMASCINCAPALRRCPICRTFIKGTVKAIMS